MRACGTLRSSSSGIPGGCQWLELKPSAAIMRVRVSRFRVKTAIPGLIDAMPAKRGVGVDRRLSLSGMPVLKPGLVRSRSYALSPSARSSMARSDTHRWQIVTPMCSNYCRGVPDLPQCSRSVGSPSPTPVSWRTLHPGNSLCGVFGLSIMRSC